MEMACRTGNHSRHQVTHAHDENAIFFNSCSKRNKMSNLTLLILYTPQSYLQKLWSQLLVKAGPASQMTRDLFTIMQTR